MEAADDIISLRMRMAHLWAKSPKSGEQQGQSLWDHTAAVCTQMSRYYALWRFEWSGRERVCLARVFAYAALLHDLGKVHRGFQAMLRGGGRRFQNRHEILSLAFLMWLEIPDSERAWVAAGIAFHHRAYSALFDANRPFYPGERFGADGTLARVLVEGVATQDLALVRELLVVGPRLLAACGWERLDPYPLANVDTGNLLRGMRNSIEEIRRLSISFRVRQERPGPRPKANWSELRKAIQIRGLLINSDHIGSYGVQEIKQQPQSVEQLKGRLADRISHYALHQVEAGKQEGSCILVAPTGSGKTEAALLWAARQAEAGSRGRLYFMLPYQASMNAAQKRLVGVFAPDLLNRPEGWSAEVSLIHGRSVRTLYERLMDHGYDPKESARIAVEQNDLARLQTSPISVSSPFQLIRLLFAPHGVEALLVALWEGRIVLDEIHAYDVEITALALAALGFVTERLGVRTLVMTATLPQHLEKAIQETQAVLPIIRAGADVMDQPPRHRVRLLPFHSQSKQSEKLILERANAGAAVLVVLNQVLRARQLYERLDKKAPSVKLLHSRFTYADRAKKEREIEPEAGRVLISTQAVEVSLDLDYDCCYTEVAPMESLLQRFGRCNRRGDRPSAVEVGIFESFPGGQPHPELPYDKEHLAAVLGVLKKFLSNHASREIREGDVQGFVNESYPECLRSDLYETIKRRTVEVRRSLIDNFEPWGISDVSSVRRLAEEWEGLFDGEEILPVSLAPLAASKESWIDRARYLVPISRRQFQRLTGERRVKWNEEMKCSIAEAEYQPTTGLEL